MANLGLIACPERSFISSEVPGSSQHPAADSRAQRRLRCWRPSGPMSSAACRGSVSTQARAAVPITKAAVGVSVHSGQCRSDDRGAGQVADRAAGERVGDVGSPLAGS